MTVALQSASESIARFVCRGLPSDAARSRASEAFTDTIGVMLAGSAEPAATLVSTLAFEESVGECQVVGTGRSASATSAAMANGTAAHALDFDDMCFVSLAHPSCVLVAAALSIGEIAHASGRTLLDAYVVGFELECRLGRVMNPQHYQYRGWHCTSTLGSIGAAAAAARILGLDETTTGHALAIAASEACGIKENIGTMVKPLHAGLAARNGVTAALLASRGMTGSPRAFDGPQGFLVAMDSQKARTLDAAVADLGVRWEIVETGITVKLYPSCAATHAALDAILDLKREERFDADDLEAIEVDVDTLTPTLLTYHRPSTGLEAKFSMPYCAAAAVVDGRVGIDTFQETRIRDPRVQSLLRRVIMRSNPAFDSHAPMSQAGVTVRLRDGRVLTGRADGARGYPAKPATTDELAAKFDMCARRVLSERLSTRAWAALGEIDQTADVRAITALLQPEA
jgi:2-methylcitrate dehydratase PrpD